MKNRITLFLIILILPLCVQAEEEKAAFVDISAANDEIVSLQKEILFHENKIADDEREIAGLELETERRTSRLEKIDSDMASARESNVELNELYRVTKDSRAKEQIEKTRSELLSILWILNNEREELTSLNDRDNSRIVFLSDDIERRRTVISVKSQEIPVLEESVRITEEKIGEIYSKLNTISSTLSDIRLETAH